MAGRFVQLLLGQLFLFQIVLVNQARGEKVTVELNHGKIRGKDAVDENGNTYYAFKGIPFAEAPTGNLRFQLPVPKQPWDGVLDAFADGPPCPQVSMFTRQFEGQEDNCLTLNVYTPQLPSHDSNVRLDVVYNIHGGGFSLGSGGEGFLYHPKRFMPKEKNIVLVSVTYRVASLGFLSTSNTAASGNYGMLDQVEGLRWVRNNIDKFGGDPNKVTIIGESAGGASVLYHFLSPLSKGLFHKAIAMSGTPLNPWAYQPQPRYWAEDLAKQVGCPTDDMNRLVKCLKAKPAKELIINEKTFESKPVRFIYTPTVDHYFLPDTPINIIKNKQYNDVPLLTGVTKDEGNCWFAFDVPKPSGEEFTDEEIHTILIALFNTVTNLDEAIDKIKNRYIQSHHPRAIHAALGKIITDGYFRTYHYETVKLLAETGATVYAYSYDYKGISEGFKKIFKIPDDIQIGACHGFDLANFFASSMMGKQPQTGENLEVQKKMQTLFFNFALNGNPNSDNNDEWPLVTPNAMQQYHIDAESSVSVYEPTKDDTHKFWVEEIPKTIDLHGYSVKEEL